MAERTMAASCGSSHGSTQGAKDEGASKDKGSTKDGGPAKSLDAGFDPDRPPVFIVANEVLDVLPCSLVHRVHGELDPQRGVADNARDWIEGEVLFIDAGEIALLRSDPEVGEVAVHFPRVGYDWRAA